MVDTWFITANRAKADWGTAVVAGRASTTIYQLTVDGDGSERLQLWARGGHLVSPHALAAAQRIESAAAVPAPLVEHDPLPHGFGTAIHLGDATHLPGASGVVGAFTVDNDATPNGGWPNRFTFMFSDGGTTRLTGYHNEYGEVRARPAKRNTVALRTQEHADGSTGDIFQVTDAANVPYFGVSGSAVTSKLPVKAPNISVDAVRTADAAPIQAVTAVVPDLELQLPLEASATYIVEGVIVYDCSATADLKMQFQMSSPPTLCAIALDALTSAATSNTNSTNFARRVNDSSIVLGGAGAGAALAVPFRGVVATNAAANLTVAYAQNASDPTDLVVRAGSHISARKIRAS